MRDQEWDSASANLYSPDLAQLVFCLCLFDSVHGKPALDVVDETEVLASLVDRDDVHEASWVGVVCSHLSVDLDEALHHDQGNLSASERILEAISEEDDER